MTQFEDRRCEYRLRKEGKLRVARLTALLHEFELHLCMTEMEPARDCLATITTTLAFAPEVTSQVDLLSSNETKIAHRSVRIEIGASDSAATRRVCSTSPYSLEDCRYAWLARVTAFDGYNPAIAG